MKKPIALLTATAAAIAIIALSGCSSRKNSGETNGNDYTEQKQQKSQPATLFEQLTQSYSQWQSLAVPVKVELQSPLSIALSGKAYMINGQSVYISLRFMGMEVATINISNDSIQATEKIHKYYVAESLKSLLGGAKFSVTDLQDLLLGRAFTLGNGTLTSSSIRDLSIAANPNGGITITPRAAAGATYAFTALPSPIRVTTLTVTAPGYKPVSCIYSQPLSTPYGTLAQTTSLEASTPKTSIKASMVWSLNQAKWNSPNDIKTWSPPKGYNRLGKNDILKMLPAL